MRGRHLHWSWAAVAAAMIALTPPLGSHLGSALGIAGASAALLCRRWHREDLDAGGDLAELARSRRSPLAPLRSLAGARHCALVRGADARWPMGSSWCSAATSAGGRCRSRSARAGGSAHAGRRRDRLGQDRHADVDRAARDRATAWGRSSSTRRATRRCAIGLRRAALAAGSPFIEWTPDGAAVYNPYARGSDDRDRRQGAGGRALHRAALPASGAALSRARGARAARGRERDVSLRRIVEHLDPARLELLARELPEAQAQRHVHAYLDSLTARQRSDLAGVRDRLAILAESDVGRWLDPRRAARRVRPAPPRCASGRSSTSASQSDRRPLLSADARRGDRAGPADDRRGAAA